uniref:Uncharacterized protein n=1 Tax=Trichobilharzia regenti TaxID=157069 RepID=A0AA85KLF6_TRIRE|nr:unnamed protein product [Trichobilharzia regenti]
MHDVTQQSLRLISNLSPFPSAYSLGNRSLVDSLYCQTSLLPILSYLPTILSSVSMQLRWLIHVLRMPSHHLPRQWAMLADIGSGWKRVSGGQTKTWLHQSMKSTRVSLSCLGSS